MAKLRERLSFDAKRGEYRDGDIRYMMIRPDALMGLFAELPPPARGDALAAFARSVRRFGGRSARSYPAADAQALLEVIAATAPELGWGVWDLRRVGEELALKVDNSPFAAGAGRSDEPVCAPIAGMLTAVGEMALGGPVTVAETQCVAAGAPCCRFAVRRIDPPRTLDAPAAQR